MSCQNHCQLPQLPTLPMGKDNFAPFSTERLFTTEEAAAYLRVGERALAKFITGDRANKLKASWIGRRWIISEGNLQAFIGANEQDVSKKK